MTAQQLLLSIALLIVCARALFVLLRWLGVILPPVSDTKAGAAVDTPEYTYPVSGTPPTSEALAIGFLREGLPLVMDCTRQKPHDGPCNGYQTPACVAAAVPDTPEPVAPPPATPSSELASMESPTPVLATPNLDDLAVAAPDVSVAPYLPSSVEPSPELCQEPTAPAPVEYTVVSVNPNGDFTTVAESAPLPPRKSRRSSSTGSRKVSPPRKSPRAKKPKS